MDNQAALIRLVDTASFAGIAAMAGTETGASGQKRKTSD
jgi:hypothetical protein